MTRADQGLLVAARTAPNDRVTLVARLEETLWLDDGEYAILSTQDVAEDSSCEDGWQYLSSFVVEDIPRWA